MLIVALLAVWHLSRQAKSKAGLSVGVGCLISFGYGLLAVVLAFVATGVFILIACRSAKF